jgi:hypothetical protein
LVAFWTPKFESFEPNVDTTTLRHDSRAFGVRSKFNTLRRKRSRHSLSSGDSVHQSRISARLGSGSQKPLPERSLRGSRANRVATSCLRRTLKTSCLPHLLEIGCLQTAYAPGRIRLGALPYVPSDNSPARLRHTRMHLECKGKGMEERIMTNSTADFCLGHTVIPQRFGAIFQVIGETSAAMIGSK